MTTNRQSVYEIRSKTHLNCNSEILNFIPVKQYELINKYFLRIEGLGKHMIEFDLCPEAWVTDD